MQCNAMQCRLLISHMMFNQKVFRGPGNFVGAVATKSKKHTLWRVCPRKCRRKKSWIHCLNIQSDCSADNKALVFKVYAEFPFTGIRD